MNPNDPDVTLPFGPPNYTRLNALNDSAPTPTPPSQLSDVKFLNRDRSELFRPDPAHPATAVQTLLSLIDNGLAEYGRAQRRAGCTRFASKNGGFL